MTATMRVPFIWLHSKMRAGCCSCAWMTVVWLADTITIRLPPTGRGGWQEEGPAPRPSGCCLQARECIRGADTMKNRLQAGEDGRGAVSWGEGGQGFGFCLH